MNDDRLDAALGSFYRDTTATPPDQTQGVAEVMTLVGRTRQRGRQWPLPAFERARLPAFPARQLAPAPIPATNGHAPARGFTMFSAVKFIAASVILALFGGFLMMGVLSTQQDDEVLTAASASPTVEATVEPTEAATPSVRSDILPGVELIVEEVEPGVFRVLNDGVRDLASLSNWHLPEWRPEVDDDPWQALDAIFGDLVVGHDGSVWLMRAKDFVRLGSDERYDLPEGWDRRLVVSPDGTVWVSSTRMGSSEGEEVTRLHSLEDGAWSTRQQGPAFWGPQALTVAPDATIWATHPAKGKRTGVIVTHLGADGWQRLKVRAPEEGELFVTESGEIWIAPEAMGRGLQRRDANGVWQEDGPWRTIAKRGDLWRYRDERSGWQGVPVRAVAFRPHTSGAEVGADGTVWYVGIEPRMADGTPVLDADGHPRPGDSFLMRFDGTEWQRWGPADGVPSLLGAIVTVGLEQAPDGALWMRVHDADPEHGAGQADIARFDGSRWRHFLRGHGVDSWDMQIAPDGTVWLLASGDARDERANGLYVITPEAVASGT